MMISFQVHLHIIKVWERAMEKNECSDRNLGSETKSTLRKLQQTDDGPDQRTDQNIGKFHF